VFLIDVSGSMTSPDKLLLAKRALIELVERLRGQDRIALVVYAGAAGVVLPPTKGSDKQAIVGALDRLEAGGSTNGGEGIERAYELARSVFIADGNNRVILATDGDFNVGVTDHDELVELIERQRKSGIDLSVLGFGVGNDALMEQLADKGNGNYAAIDSLSEARKVLVEQAGGTLVTIAKDVKVQVAFDPTSVERFRLIGYENRVLAHRDFDDDAKDAGEIGSGHSVTALYEVELQPGGKVDRSRLLDLDLRYKPPQSDTSRKLSFVVDDARTEQDETSIDFRWAAAVAEFGMLLRKSEHRGDASWRHVAALAAGARGADPSCRRHEMLELIEAAAQLEGAAVGSWASQCIPAEQRRHSDEMRDERHLQPIAESHLQPRGASDDGPPSAATKPPHVPDEHGQSFWLELLRLLPPLLAFPLFILALRDPARRPQATDARD
jgi:Ca-activated chloride channel family protein